VPWMRVRTAARVPRELRVLLIEACSLGSVSCTGPHDEGAYRGLAVCAQQPAMLPGRAEPCRAAAHVQAAAVRTRAPAHCVAEVARGTCRGGAGGTVREKGWIQARTSLFRKTGTCTVMCLSLQLPTTLHVLPEAGLADTVAFCHCVVFICALGHTTLLLGAAYLAPESSSVYKPMTGTHAGETVFCPRSPGAGPPRTRGRRSNLVHKPRAVPHQHRESGTVRGQCSARASVHGAVFSHTSGALCRALSFTSHPSTQVK
jgi:hypothetical protein